MLCPCVKLRVDLHLLFMYRYLRVELHSSLLCFVLDDYSGRRSGVGGDVTALEKPMLYQSSGRGPLEN